MSDDPTPTPGPDPAPEPAPPADPPEQKPPWGSDDEFDPQRAWTLIQGVRGDLDKVKSERDQLRTKVQEREDADKTEQQRAAEAREQAVQEAADARAEALRLRMAIKYGLDEDDLDLLGTGDEETIEKRAKRLAERSAPADDAPRRPRERLRPGAAPGAEPEKNDPATLAAQVPRGW